MNRLPLLISYKLPRVGKDFVIKAAIAGSPSRLRQFCREHEIDAVFSSVFETAIGTQAALKLAVELSQLPTGRRSRCSQSQSRQKKSSCLSCEEAWF